MKLNQLIHLHSMMNTKMYILKGTTIKTNAIISFGCIIVFIIMSFFSYNAQAEPSDNATIKHDIKKKLLNSKIKPLSTQSLKTINNTQQSANVTYRTVLSSHEKKNTVKTNTDYVIFSPEKELPTPYYRYVHKRNVKTFSDITFFEKAMLFNDKLQTWVN